MCTRVYGSLYVCVYVCTPVCMTLCVYMHVCLCVCMLCVWVQVFPSGSTAVVLCRCDPLVAYVCNLDAAVTEFDLTQVFQVCGAVE